MKKVTNFLFCAILVLGTFLFQSNSVSADNEGYFEKGVCNANCELKQKGTCVSRNSTEDKTDGIVYDCKAGTTNNPSAGGGSSFPLENGSSSATNNPTTAVPQTNSGSNYSFPSLWGSQSGVSNGQCENGYSKSAGVCIPENTGLSGQTVQQILSNLLFWLLAVFATIAVIAFLISGIQYLISSGDEKMAETAKRNMVYSIIGILIGLSGLIVLKAISALLNANTVI